MRRALASDCARDRALRAAWGTDGGADFDDVLCLEATYDHEDGCAFDPIVIDVNASSDTATLIAVVAVFFACICGSIGACICCCVSRRRTAARRAAKENESRTELGAAAAIPSSTASVQRESGEQIDAEQASNSVVDAAASASTRTEPAAIANKKLCSHCKSAPPVAKLKFTDGRPPARVCNACSIALQEKAKKDAEIADAPPDAPPASDSDSSSEPMQPPADDAVREPPRISAADRGEFESVRNEPDTWTLSRTIELARSARRSERGTTVFDQMDVELSDSYSIDLDHDNAGE